MTIDLVKLLDEINSFAKFKAFIEYSPSRNCDVLKVGSFVVLPDGRWLFAGEVWSDMTLRILDTIRSHVAPPAEARPEVIRERVARAAMQIKQLVWDSVEFDEDGQSRFACTSGEFWDEVCKIDFSDFDRVLAAIAGDPGAAVRPTPADDLRARIREAVDLNLNVGRGSEVDQITDAVLAVVQGEGG